MSELRTLYRASPRLLSRTTLPLSSHQTRSFATALPDTTVNPSTTDTSAPRASRRPTTRFADKLNTGPSFSEFAGSDAQEPPLSRTEALELKTAMVGPPGRKKEITRLPEWLKTPIPVSENFKKIRNDLRGLNLHTGKPCFTGHSNCRIITKYITNSL